MSHDQTSDPMTRQERRRKFELKPFSADDHVRTDWSVEDMIEFLETRALGYNGLLRQILCTAAAMLRDAVSEDLLQKREDVDQADDQARNRVDPERDGS